jgi:hypothetical protein
MFARIALRLALVPLRSPYSWPGSGLVSIAPAFHVAAARSCVRPARGGAIDRGHRRGTTSPCLIDSAVVSLPRIAKEAARGMARRACLTSDSTWALG